MEGLFSFSPQDKKLVVYDRFLDKNKVFNITFLPVMEIDLSNIDNKVFEVVICLEDRD